MGSHESQKTLCVHPVMRRHLAGTRRARLKQGAKNVARKGENFSQGPDQQASDASACPRCVVEGMFGTVFGKFAVEGEKRGPEGLQKHRFFCSRK